MLLAGQSRQGYKVPQYDDIVGRMSRIRPEIA